MPWYTNPDKTRNLLNRIANRHAQAPLDELTRLLDQATEKIWLKRVNYNAKEVVRRNGS